MKKYGNFLEKHGYLEEVEPEVYKLTDVCDQELAASEPLGFGD